VVEAVDVRSVDTEGRCLLENMQMRVAFARVLQTDGSDVIQK
jgi:hypothetical protein